MMPSLRPIVTGLGLADLAGDESRSQSGTMHSNSACGAHCTVRHPFGAFPPADKHCNCLLVKP